MMNNPAFSSLTRHLAGLHPARPFFIQRVNNVFRDFSNLNKAVWSSAATALSAGALCLPVAHPSPFLKADDFAHSKVPFVSHMKGNSGVFWNDGKAFRGDGKAHAYG